MSKLCMRLTFIKGEGGGYDIFRAQFIFSGTRIV